MNDMALSIYNFLKQIISSKRSFTLQISLCGAAHQSKPGTQQAKQGPGENLLSFNIQHSELLIEDCGHSLCGIR